MVKNLNIFSVFATNLSQRLDQKPLKSVILIGVYLPHIQFSCYLIDNNLNFVVWGLKYTP